jgi:RNA-directed DNA polymerase
MLRTTCRFDKRRQKQAQQSGCNSRRADSALKHPPRNGRPKKSAAVKLVEKSGESELTLLSPMSEEIKDNAHRVKDYIVVTSKQPNSAVGPSKSGGLRSKRTCSKVGAGDGDAPVTVTPGAGEQVRPKVSDAAELERGNPPSVLRKHSPWNVAEGSTSDPKHLVQTHKPRQKGGEGIAQKQTPAVTSGMCPRGDGHHGCREERQKPQSRKVGKEIAQARHWGEIPWRQVQRAVYKLEHLIYIAAKQKRFNRVKQLQTQLVRSFNARLLAVRQVCEINNGKNSAGIDGACSLTNTAKWNLAGSMGFEKPHQPYLCKRIPKPGKSEQRPLSLPTLEDRCRCRLLAFALQPEVEARLHKDVYGYRPGRSAHDAISSVRRFCDKVAKGKFVLDADIENFFGSVSRDSLMRCIKLPRPLKRFIRTMLHAPTMDNGRMISTSGIPQGSPLSPVLANLVLTGLHDHVEQHFLKLRKNDRKLVHWKTPAVIVYADDLVAIHVDHEALQQAQAAIEDFLRPRGLRLHPDKTSIRHTLDGHLGTPGFDFLGFHVRSFRVGKTKKPAGKIGLQTLIQPSKKSILRHHANLATILRSNRHQPIRNVIVALNRSIRGWCSYYRTENSAQTFRKEDHTLFRMLWQFIKRRHQKKTPAGELYATYWPRLEGRKRFRDPTTGETLISHVDFHVKPHIKVRGDASAYDGNRAYWATRRKRIHPLQRERALHCDRDDEEQLTPTCSATEADASNVWLLRYDSDMADTMTGEPDAVKVARPVLKERLVRRRANRL